MISKIQAFMKTYNLTQRETAAMLNTGESQLNRWLKGKNKISKLWLKEIERVISEYQKSK